MFLHKPKPDVTPVIQLIVSEHVTDANQRKLSTGPHQFVIHKPTADSENIAPLSDNFPAKPSSILTFYYQVFI